LALLAETSLEGLSTRQIARRLGLSQPALFRHFRSREALMLAAVDHVRVELAAIVETLLRGSGSPVEQLRTLSRGLLEHVERRPGLPRLLFAELSDAGPVHNALAHVLSMQITLATELFAEGQRRGLLREDVDAADGAAAFAGLLQGLILQWQAAGRREPLAARADAAFGLWLEGTRAQPGTASAQRSPEVERPPSRAGLDSLDVRPLLAAGVDPLSHVLAGLGGLAPGSVLTVVAPFEPRPLVALLSSRGHGVTLREVEPRLFVVDVVVDGTVDIEDLTALEAPEPLERVLERCAHLGRGTVYLARLPRFPRLLVPRLEERGLAHQVQEQPDGTALLRVQPKGPIPR